MSSRKIATSTLWQIASQVTMAALSILTVKFVAIGLSKELAGNYNSAYGYLQLFGIFADFGLYAVAVREVNAVKNKEEILSALIILRLLILMLSLGTAFFFVWLVPAWRETPLPLSVMIAALVPLFTLLAGILRTVFQVEYKMQYVFVAEVTQRVITVLLIGFLIASGIRGSTDLHHLHLFLFFGGVGAFVLFAISFFFADRLISIRFHWNTVLIMRLLKKAAPFGIAYLCVAFYRQFDLTLIALLRPDFELQNAYYGFVVRIMDMAFVIPTFLLNSTLPIVSGEDMRGKDTRDLLGRTLLVILILGSISFLYAFLWPRPLMQLVTTEAYLSTDRRIGSDTALRLLALPMFLNGIVLYGFYILLTRHCWRPLVSALGLGVLISLLFNVQLIPSFGFVGAAVTSIIVHLILVLILLPKSLSVMPIRLPLWSIARWVTFIGVFAGVLSAIHPFLTSEIHTVLGLAVSTAILWALLYTTGLLKTVGYAGARSHA